MIHVVIGEIIAPNATASYRAEELVATLERACATTGYPKTIRVDQGAFRPSLRPRLYINICHCAFLLRPYR
jgi:hypothetical protein